MYYNILKNYHGLFINPWVGTALSAGLIYALDGYSNYIQIAYMALGLTSMYLQLKPNPWDYEFIKNSIQYYIRSHLWEFAFTACTALVIFSVAPSYLSVSFSDLLVRHDTARNNTIKIINLLTIASDYILERIMGYNTMYFIKSHQLNKISQYADKTDKENLKLLLKEINFSFKKLKESIGVSKDIKLYINNNPFFGGASVGEIVVKPFVELNIGTINYHLNKNNGDSTKTIKCLNAIIACELGHIQHHHTLKKLLLKICITTAEVISSNILPVVYVNTILSNIGKAFSQHNEYEADDVAIKAVGKKAFIKALDNSFANPLIQILDPISQGSENTRRPTIINRIERARNFIDTFDRSLSSRASIV
ncbi:hypothetical protein NF27_DP01890 [Candidatus Jidaibacter acanthamoeba]|uniref:Peptidase M48 domain-containing protein n=1 Tax=Candidatus Jidaibacter acanthamoebae TaxID=86105 RepID=A0A0C1R023_9RICK|nr:M48 family metalloprotease [Candidatus Jidaibacter acanthamoeba]KIE05645.1 hypothetical protein NF27_DP01890 [Candidatus Jidaibacter acanthamoeba]